MSPIYHLIQSTIQTAVLAALRAGKLDMNVYWAQMLVDVLTFITHLLFIAVVGLFLWNQGLSTTISIIQPIGNTAPQRYRNKYIQWLVTALAISLVF